MFENKYNKNKIVLSVSRRTDIPAFYLSWFMRGIERGCFDVVNPYNQKVRHVPADTSTVHTIVFWSKDFGRFLEEKAGETLQQKGYHLFFNYTLNSHLPLLEPNVPPLKKRMEHLDELCRRFGPRSVSWRFDPICFYQLDGGPMKTNLSDFLQIANRAGEAGIQRCITSFMDHYPKIKRRAVTESGLKFLDPSLEHKVDTLLWMNVILRPMGIELHTCCERDVANRLPAGSGIKESACVPNNFLVGLYGGQLSFKRDPGQRRPKGCRCQVSVDVGSYREHPCGHSCLYCYANPIQKAPGWQRERVKASPDNYITHRPICD